MDYPNEQQPEVLTPFVALMMGKDEDDQYLISASFLALDDALQEILVGEGTTMFITSWVTAGLLPQTHAVAVSKLIGMLALEDEVAIEAVPQILEKLGLPTTSALQIANGIEKLIQPFAEAQQEELVVAPLKAPIPPLPPKTSVPTRNIIDLRNKPSA